MALNYKYFALVRESAERRGTEREKEKNAARKR